MLYFLMAQVTNTTTTTSRLDKLSIVEQDVKKMTAAPDYLQEKIGEVLKELVNSERKIEKKDLEKLTDEVVQNAYAKVPLPARRILSINIQLQLSQFTSVYDILAKLSS
jgi:hypothetical protein